MIGINRSASERLRRHERFVCECRCRLVRMNDTDALADEDVAEYRRAGEERRQRRLCGDGNERQMIDFESAAQVANVLSSAAVRVADDDDVMTAKTQRLRDIVLVKLNATETRIEEVTDEGNTVMSRCTRRTQR